MLNVSERTYKEWMARWDALVEKILETTIIDVAEAAEVREQRIIRLEADPEEWFRYYFPQYAFAPPAAFHKEATKRVLEHPEWYEVRMWSRELAKSTRTMMEVLYLTLVGHIIDKPGSGSGDSTRAAPVIMTYHLRLKTLG